MAGLMMKDDVGESVALMVARGVSEDAAERRVTAQEARGYLDKGIAAGCRREAFMARLDDMKRDSGEEVAEAWRVDMVRRIKALAA